MLKNYRDMAVLIDFDGTITDSDTNIKLFEEKSTIDLNLLDIDRDKGVKKLTYVEKIQYVFDSIKITEDEYRDFILDNFTLTKGFKGFIEKLREKDIPVAIVSGGFRNAIDIFLREYGIENIPVYAHKLVFHNRDIEVDVYKDPVNCCENGPCGNCKILRYKEFKEVRNNIVFIGDGFTDRWVSHKAEILFAKSMLADYCRDNDIDYFFWEDFTDIENTLGI